MGEGMNQVVPDMTHSQPVRIRLLPAGWAKAVVVREHCRTVQAVSGVHVNSKYMVRGP